jgi:pilus assembly protein Flp/PilA
VIYTEKGGVIVSNPLTNFVSNDESGQGMVEYGLIVGLIAIIVIAVFVALSPQLGDIFSGKGDSAMNGTSGNVMSGNSMSGNAMSGNAMSGNASGNY